MIENTIPFLHVLLVFRRIKKKRAQMFTKFLCHLHLFVPRARLVKYSRCLHHHLHLFVSVVALVTVFFTYTSFVSTVETSWAYFPSSPPTRRSLIAASRSRPPVRNKGVQGRRAVAGVQWPAHGCSPRQPPTRHLNTLQHHLAIRAS